MPYENIEAWQRNGELRGTLAPLKGSAYKMIDAHLHVVNFIQESPGSEALLRAMNKSNVEKAVIFGLPVVKIWECIDREPPDYYLANDSHCYYYGLTDILVYDFVNALPFEDQKRFYPLMCGFNPTDKNAIKHVEWLYNRYPGFWHGIGELLLRHDDLTAFTYGESPRANHRALWPVYEFAADKNLPVLLHQNVSSITKKDHPIYLYELEEALLDFPKTQFILAHCGISRRINLPYYFLMIERLLDQYEHLSVDISWIIFDEVICPNRIPDKNWLNLIEKYSSRICIGSDLVTRFERLGIELHRYDVFLENLSAQAIADVCRNTAEHLYGKKEM